MSFCRVLCRVLALARPFLASSFSIDCNSGGRNVEEICKKEETSSSICGGGREDGDAGGGRGCVSIPNTVSK